MMTPSGGAGGCGEAAAAEGGGEWAPRCGGERNPPGPPLNGTAGGIGRGPLGSGRGWGRAGGEQGGVKGGGGRVGPGVGGNGGMGGGMGGWGGIMGFWGETGG